MKVDMLMPQMGESIAEATISKWLKTAGERVEKDETILEISTDKVDSEIPAPASGILSEVLFNEGAVVPVKTKIAIIETNGAESRPRDPAPRSVPTAQVQPTPAPAVPEHKTQAPSVGLAAAVEEPKEPASRFYSPLVMSLASKHNLSMAELEKIPGSGQGGRVTKQDLLEYIEAKGSTTAQPAREHAIPAAPCPANKPVSAVKPAPAPKPDANWSAEGTKTIVMDTMRQAIAEHMVRSKHTSPHVYSVQEIDVTKVSRWRQAHKGEFEKQEGFKLSVTPFFLDATVRALIKFPYVNSSVEGKNVVLKKHVNLGCAVALGDAQRGFGLIVPVIHNAEEKTLVGLARALNDLANRARTKKLLPDDVAGGTFTVTNPGIFGTMIGTPIINQPQVAILCLGAITKRPVVIDDMLAIREMCFLTLSYDHRVVDGALGGMFLAEIGHYLENWDEGQAL